MTAPAARLLYLIRHCAATGQAPDASLTLEGVAQAAVLADLLVPLGITRILSSPLARARDSIAPLAVRLGIPVETDARLVERVLTTEPLPDWRAHLARSFDDETYCLAGGESSRAAIARAVAVLDAVRQRPAPATVIVTHGNLLALLLRHFDRRARSTLSTNCASLDVKRIEKFGVRRTGLQHSLLRTSNFEPRTSPSLHAQDNRGSVVVQHGCGAIMDTGGHDVCYSVPAPKSTGDVHCWR